MTTKTDAEINKETLQRVIRTETRIVSLAAKLGIDLVGEEEFEVDVERQVLTVKTLDVALTSILKAARRAGLHGRRVDVLHNGEYICTMPV